MHPSCVMIIICHQTRAVFVELVCVLIFSFFPGPVVRWECRKALGQVWVEMKQMIFCGMIWGDEYLMILKSF